MAWVRLEPELIDHPKIIGLPDAAFALHIRAICYCNRHLTDGAIPRAALSKLGKKTAAAALVSAGVWHQDATGNYQIHDYLEYQPSRRMVEGRRAELSSSRSTSGARGASKRWGKRVANAHGVDGKRVVSEWQDDGPDPDPDKRDPPLVPQRQQFDRWWAAYPRKVAKQQAWRMWERISPDALSFAKMMGTLALQVSAPEWQRDGGKFIPHPATYLHQGRYEDDVTAAPMLPPAMEAYATFEQWDWCDTCGDAHVVGKCPRASVAS